MKIIFLDIDGVITSPRTLSWFNFDIYAVNFLRWLCVEVDIKIVISSTWRLNHSKQFFEAIFGNIIHDDWKTKSVRMDRRRGLEIDEWLSRHSEVTRYLILDDDSDMLENQIPSFIQTDSVNGMLSEQMEKIRDYFEVKGWRKETTLLHQHKYMFATYNLGKERYEN